MLDSLIIKSVHLTVRVSYEIYLLLLLLLLLLLSLILSLLTDSTRIKILIAPYVMRSRVHAKHRGLIAWWEGDTKREKEDERLKIASGTVLSNDRVHSRLLGKHKFDAKELFPT